MPGAVRSAAWDRRAISVFAAFARAVLQCARMNTTPSLIIAIGSTNPVKVRAARAVLEPLYPGADFRALDVPSGVSAQPWSDAETRAGAINRARAACAAAQAHFGVGLEGGVTEIEAGLMLCNWAAFYAAADGRLGIGSGGGLLLPKAIAAYLAQGIELGPATDLLSGGHDTRSGEGAVGVLTAGLVDRQSAFEYTIKLALAPFRTAPYYDHDPDRVSGQPAHRGPHYAAEHPSASNSSPS